MMNTPSNNNLPTKTSPIPRKLNQGMITALSLAIAKGNYVETACDLCGISRPTFYEWVKLAQEDEESGLSEEESIYLSLANALKRSQAEAESELVNVVRNSATIDKNWIAGMTFLERRHPDRWGRRERHDINIESKTVNIVRVETHLARSAGEIVEGEVREIEEGKEDGI